MNEFYGHVPKWFVESFIGKFNNLDTFRDNFNNHITLDVNGKCKFTDISRVMKRASYAAHIGNYIRRAKYDSQF